MAPRKTLYLRQRGFSVLETILVMTLLVAFAAVVVPSVTREMDDVETARASADCREIATGLLHFARDTGFKPCGFRGSSSYAWLRGDGTPPAFPEQPGKAGNISWFLGTNLMGGGVRWAGPYYDDPGADPWGRQYVVLVKPFWRGEKAEPDARPENVWVLSAGPNGEIETRPEDPVPGGDDIGLMLQP